MIARSPFLLPPAAALCALLAAPGGPGNVAGAEPSGEAYVSGIEALAAGDHQKAVSDLGRAIAADEENAACHRARGVAHTLAENFPAAIADLERALRLDGKDQEAKLWLAAAYRMSGDPGKGASLFTFNGVPHDYADKRQRDDLARELQDPNLPTADRRALEMSLAELDRIIAQRSGAPGAQRSRAFTPGRPR